MARRKSNSENDDASPLDFETALGGIEAIVEAMENEHLALEELVTHYEKGSELLQRCESILQSAKERIEIITLRNQNQITLDATPNLVDTNIMIDDSDDDNDIRLF